jgi:hypothetical protein
VKESINISAADIPISDLNIYTKNFRIVYEPKQDITPYELSRLMQLFFVVTTNKRYGFFKIEEFLQEHNLGRHFSYHPLNA